MTTDNAKQVALDLLVWIDDNATSVRQALVMAAESNEADAAAMDRSDQQAVGQLMRESGQAWRKRADEFDKLYRQMSSDPDDLGLV